MGINKLDELVSWYGGISSNGRPSGTLSSVEENLGEAAGVVLLLVLERAEEDRGRVLVIVIHTSSRDSKQRSKPSVRLLPHRRSIVGWWFMDL